jgi:hypothetical protein
MAWSKGLGPQIFTTAARGCSNFNNLRKVAAGRVVTTLEFYNGLFWLWTGNLGSNFDQTPTAKERMRILGRGAPEGAHVDNRSVLAIR